MSYRRALLLCVTASALVPAAANGATPTLQRIGCPFVTGPVALAISADGARAAVTHREPDPAGSTVEAMTLFSVARDGRISQQGAGWQLNPEATAGAVGFDRGERWLASSSPRGGTVSLWEFIDGEAGWHSDARPKFGAAPTLFGFSRGAGLLVGLSARDGTLSTYLVPRKPTPWLPHPAIRREVLLTADAYPTSARDLPRDDAPAPALAVGADGRVVVVNDPSDPSSMVAFALDRHGGFKSDGDAIRLGAGAEPAAFAFSDDDRLLAVANRGTRTVSLFAVAKSGTLTELRGSPVPTGARGGPVALDFEPGARRLVTANADGTLSLLQPRGAWTTPRPPSVVATGHHPSSVVLARDGRLLALEPRYGVLSVFAVDGRRAGSTPVVQVENRLLVDARSRGLPTADAQLTIGTATPGAATAPTQRFLSGFGLFPVGDERFGLGPKVDRMPDRGLVVNDRKVTFTLRLAAQFGAGSTQYGRWSFTSHDGEIEATTSQVCVPGDSSVDVVVDVRDATIVSAKPDPDAWTDSQTHAVWTVHGPGVGSPITVRVRPNEPTRLLLLTQQSWPYVVQLVEQIAVAVFAPIVIIGVLWRRKACWVPERTHRAVGQLVRAAGALLVVAVFVALVYVLVGVPIAFSVGERALRWLAIATSVAVVMALAGLFRFAVRPRRWPGRILFAIAAAAVLGAVTLLTLLRFQIELEPEVTMAPLLGLVSALTVVIATLTGMVLAVARALSGSRSARLAAAVAAIVLGAVAVQWASGARHSHTVANADYQFALFTGIDGAHTLAYLAGTFPLSLLGILLGFAIVLLLPAILRVIRSDATTPTLPVASPAGRAVVVLFACYVCGTYGPLFGFSFPLPAIVGGVALWAWLRFTPCPAIAPDDPAHGSGLASVTELSRVRDDLHRLYGRYREGDLTAAEYARARTRVSEELAELTPDARSWTERIGVAGMHRSALRAFALGSGDAWSNALRAVAAGVPLTLIASGLYVFAYLTGRSADDLSSEFGILSFLIALASEATMWLTLAFVFGALYPRLPGTVGSIKALSLGALFVAAVVPALALPAATSVVGISLLLVETFLFCVLLGVLYDLRTVLGEHADWRHILDLYQLRRLRFAVGYLTPIALAIAVLIGQIVTGNAAQGAAQYVQGAPAITAPGAAPPSTRGAR